MEFAVWLKKLKQGPLYQSRGVDGAGDGREVLKGRGHLEPMANSC